jgi:ELWxxDGT repeat protein
MPRELAIFRSTSLRSQKRIRPRFEALENRLAPTVSAGLIKDLNLAPASSNPADFLTIGAITYFAANDGVHGNEIWRTDGSQAGTYMVKDLNPDGDGNPTDLINYNGKLMFLAGNNQSELWISDGTSAGTRDLRDFQSAQIQEGNFPNLAVLPNAVVFAATDTNGTAGIWRTNGTATGTVQLAAGAVDSSFTVFKTFALFAAQTPTNGIRLWRTDGTKAGTITLLSSGAGALLKPCQFNVAGNQVFFWALDGTAGPRWELWRTDGTANGTHKTLAISAGGPTFDGVDLGYLNLPGLAVSVGNELYFGAITPSDGGGNYFWKSDGTAAGTAMILSTATNNEPLEGGVVAVSNGTVLLSAQVSGTAELWRTDGTAAGTRFVADTAIDEAMTRRLGRNVFLSATTGFTVSNSG